MDLIQELKDTFQVFQDSDGTVPTQNLGVLMRSLGQEMTAVELADLIMDIDVNGNGKIDFKEFVNIMDVQTEKTRVQDDIREAFRAFDPENNGYASKEELTMFVVCTRNKTKAEAEAMLAEVADEDNHVYLHNFVALMSM